MTQTVEFKNLNWLRNLPELSETETIVVKDALKTPAVVKYLNLVALQTLTDFRLVPATEASQNVNALIAHESFAKGVISVVDSLLTFLEE